MRSLRVCVSFFTELETSIRQFAVKEMETGGRACPVQYALCTISEYFLIVFFSFFLNLLFVCFCEYIFVALNANLLCK